jgi:hypothetical protein
MGMVQWQSGCINIECISAASQAVIQSLEVGGSGETTQVPQQKTSVVLAGTLFRLLHLDDSKLDSGRSHMGRVGFVLSVIDADEVVLLYKHKQRTKERKNLQLSVQYLLLLL